MAGSPLPRLIGLLVGAASLALTGAALAEAPSETLRVAPAETPPAAAAPTVEPAPAVEAPVVKEPAPAEPAGADPPLAPPPVEAPAPAAPQPSAAAQPSAAPQPSAAAAAAPQPAKQVEASGDAEPQCALTAPDGSCALPSTECDILGDGGDNELFGTPDGEIICGLGGDDLLDGTGGGADTLVGGSGKDRFKGDDDDCVVSDDEDVEVTSPPSEEQSEEPGGRLRRRLCFFLRGEYSFATAPDGPPPRPLPELPATDTGPDDVASVGALYVALTRYASAQSSQEEAAEAIALIATRAVRYSGGEISFLVTCSRAGEVRVTLTAARRDGSRVRLGVETFRCEGDGYDRTVTVRVSQAGRRLVEGATRLRVRAQLVEAATGAATRQVFALP
jgi:hypothetical protein